MKTLVMTFKNVAEKNANITVGYPKNTLTGAVVKAAMNVVIAQNCFKSSGGDLVSAVSAKIVERTVEDVTLV